MVVTSGGSSRSDSDSWRLGCLTAIDSSLIWSALGYRVIGICYPLFVCDKPGDRFESVFEGDGKLRFCRDTAVAVLNRTGMKMRDEFVGVTEIGMVDELTYGMSRRFAAGVDEEARYDGRACTYHRR